MAGELNRNFHGPESRRPIRRPTTCPTRSPSRISPSSPPRWAPSPRSNQGRTRALDVPAPGGLPKLDNYHRVRGDRAQFTSGAPLSHRRRPRRHPPPPLARYRPRLPRRRRAPHQDPHQYPGQRGRGGRFRRFLDGGAGRLRRGLRAHVRFDAGRVGRARPRAFRALQPLSRRAHLQRHACSGSTRRATWSTPKARACGTAAATRASSSPPGPRPPTAWTWAPATPSKPWTPPACPRTRRSLNAAIDRVADDLAGLLAAPVAEPFVGPAIFSGRAAGVFFHEIFGHRIEGHRQKDESEGQTFTRSVGAQGAARVSLRGLRSHAPQGRRHGPQRLVPLRRRGREGAARRRWSRTAC